jgi:TolB-like protein/Flp pilus assembly protein TadD
MGADEEGTLAQLNAHRRALVDPKIAEHRGRVVKTTGDGMLVEFASVVDALRCAVEVQRGMAERNAEVAQDKRIEFRVGIHQGDIIVDGDDIFGDGVNVAARLESVAEPGGICVSGRVQEDTEGKLEVTFENAGEQQLKNIARPIRIYRVRLGGAVQGSRPTLLSPNKPSIAVLPFDNMSGDPTQEFLADGMVEEITTLLSHIRQFLVIARNSSFAYKGQVVNAKQVGRELGVSYILEGSVRKAASRVRVTAQLIDAITGHHVWAQNYDREFVDVFTVQDEIASKVVSAIEPQLYSAEQLRVRRKLPESLDAWECVVGALIHMDVRSKQSYTSARTLLERAITLDPFYAQAHAVHALLTCGEVSVSLKPLEAIESALEAARNSIALDDHDAWGHFALGLAYLHGPTVARAVPEFERALALNPNFAMALTNLGVAFAYLGRGEEALSKMEASERLNPRGLYPGNIPQHRAVAYFVMGRHREALECAWKAVQENPRIAASHRSIVVNSALLGQSDEAKRALEALKSQQPNLTLKWINEFNPYVDPEARQKFVRGFVLAGLT